MGAFGGSPGGRLRADALLFAVGFLAMLGQVVLLRELAVASFGVELIYLLALGLWLAAGAAGAVLGGRGASGSGAAFLALSLLLILEIGLLRGSRRLFGGVPGAYLPLGQQLATVALGTVPAGAVLGLLFRKAASALIAEGGTLASAYAWESAGGALGSVAATLSLHWGVPNLALGVGTGLAAAGIATAAGSSRRWAVPILAASVALLVRADSLDRRTTAWNHRDLAAVADTPYGRVAIARAGGQVSVFENDALAFESEGTEAEEFVHLAALQAPDSPRVLVLGGDIASLAEELLRHAPARVDAVEANRGLHRALLPHLPPGRRAILAGDPVRVVFADPRRFLAGATGYDLILVALPEPTSGQSNRFYTVEFFRQCGARLSPKGVVALRLPSAENYWIPRLLRRNGSVHSALRSAFPDVLVIPGNTDTLLASNGRLERDPGALSDRLRSRGIRGRLVTPEYLAYLLTNDRLAELERLLAATGAPPNADGRPVCYQETALLWLGRFLPSLGGAGRPDSRLWVVLAGLAAVALLAARRRTSWRRMGLVAVAGLAGMVSEAIVLLRFQAVSGSLFQDIGLLLTSFMVGLAAGAFAIDRVVAARGRVSRRWGAVLLAALAAWNAGLAAAGGAGPLFRLAPAALVLGLSGALAAALFGYASRTVEDQGGAVAPLYAADLLGGCAGAVLSGLLLIPLLGTATTAAAVAILAAASLVLL